VTLFFSFLIQEEHISWETCSGFYRSRHHLLLSFSSSFASQKPRRVPSLNERTNIVGKVSSRERERERELNRSSFERED
jgi:hypothetical protein